jgi:hypothetical protein
MPTAFMRKLRQDHCGTNSDDLAKAHQYLHEVCSAATAGTGTSEKAECYGIPDSEPVLVSFI